VEAGCAAGCAGRLCDNFLRSGFLWAASFCFLLVGAAQKTLFCFYFFKHSPWTARVGEFMLLLFQNMGLMEIGLIELRVKDSCIRCASEEGGTSASKR